MVPGTQVSVERAPLGRRLLSLIYEALLLIAVLWVAALPFAPLEAASGAPHVRPLFQAYLVAVAGVYFVWQWVRGGQTLPMKTWRLRLVSADANAVSVRQGIVRYVAAVLGFTLIGIGLFWALFDRDRQFLHDRIAKTRIIRT